MTRITLCHQRTFLLSSHTHQFLCTQLRPASTAAKKNIQPQKSKPVSKAVPNAPQKKEQQQWQHQIQPLVSQKYEPRTPKAVTRPVSTPPKSVTKPATPLSSTKASTDIINGPATTRPAVLETPERAPNQSFFFKYAFALGKSYVTFYKTGVKNILTNYKATRPIQARLNQDYQGKLETTVAAGGLNRQEFQLLTRSWYDVKRVPVFALVLMFCGEFTPFVVLAMSNVVPWTCRIPKQIDNGRRKMEQRRLLSFSNLNFGPGGPPVRIGEFGRMELLHISWSLGLSSSVWDWIFAGRLPGLPTLIVRRRVQDRLNYLGIDDKLIEKDGGVSEMDEEEVRMACVERGIDVFAQSQLPTPGASSKSEKKDVGDLKQELNQWLVQRKRAGTTIESMLLVNRSSKTATKPGTQNQ